LDADSEKYLNDYARSQATHIVAPDGKIYLTKLGTFLKKKYEEEGKNETFSVMLKEKREIIIAPRELPLNTIMLENMLKLSNLGVVIAPPILGYYSSQQTLEDMENFIIGKWMDLLKIDNKLYKRWK
jgi:polyprenyl P-hydroxybenzoate/phenylacrylic acid decarboxylase-like protein